MNLSRLFYFLLTLLLLVFFAPLLLLISVLVIIFSGFPVLYTQKRTGYRGKQFNMYKFRTMHPKADDLKNTLIRKNEAKGPVFKIYNDPRFTKIGKVLSHTGLDELPQLINILKGDMAIIGPRPLPIDEAKKLEVWQQARHRSKPGIISPWIVNGYHSNSFDEWMKSDIVYVHHKNVISDFFLLLRAGLFFLELIIKELGAKKFF